jgi:hypothetical protein
MEVWAYGWLNFLEWGKRVVRVWYRSGGMEMKHYFYPSISALARQIHTTRQYPKKRGDVPERNTTPRYQRQSPRCGSTQS